MTATTEAPARHADKEAAGKEASDVRPRSTRRWFLSAGAAVVAGGAVTVAGSGAAQAAQGARGKVKRVTKQVAITYKYNKRTHKTKVTKWRTTTVKAKFVGKKVFERDGGKWVRVPYVWSKAKKALVYSHYLHLALLPKTPTKKPDPTKPGSPVNPTTKIAAAAKPVTAAVGAYVGTSMAWHLARRATYGPNATLVAEITKAGPNAWLEQQLSPGKIPDTACDAMLRVMAKPDFKSAPLGASIRSIKDAFDNRGGKYNGVAIDDYNQKLLASRAHVVRAIWSKRQLATVMEDFWGNHFNVPYYSGQVRDSREHLAATIRPRVFGRFSDLLVAVSLHPAMLSHLNNRDSDKDHPNENQGRELLELHTVGVDAGYGESGVVNSARILTGASVSSDSGEYAYKDWKHWTGPVSVLGFSDKNDDAAKGDALIRAYLNHLAHHKSTATSIARKLATRFVSDTPSSSLVSTLAAVYLANDTAIAPVLRVLFSSAEFASSAGAKTQRPFERLVATARVLQVQPDLTPATFFSTVNTFWYKSNDGGNAPFAWAAPDGYPDVTDAWTSTAATVQSWNNKFRVVNGWEPGYGAYTNFSSLSTLLPYGVDPWGFPADYTYGALIQSVAVRLLGLPLSSAHLDAVCAFLGATRSKPLKAKATDGTPSVVTGQLGYWIAVILNSPYGLHR